MLNGFFGKLSVRLFSPLVILLIVVVLFLIFYVPGVTREHAIEAAIESAESTVKQYKTIRGYYTRNIIKKVLAGEELRPHYNHADRPDKIPLPATFIHEISNEFSKGGIINLKLYSPYPFPNRSTRRLDAFGSKAWSALNSNAKMSYSNVETINGKETVRVALADTMVAQACVDCHNKHPDTPKTGWKLNDVRGVLEVQVPIDNVLSNASKLNFTIALIVLSVLGLATGLLIFMFRTLIANRLSSVHKALTDIAEGDGDLSQRIDEEPNDEIGVIAVAFNQFSKRMSRTLTKINQQIEQLAQVTENMEAITRETQQDVLLQSEATQEVANSMTSMSSATEDMRQIASDTAEASLDTQEKSEQGSSIVEQNLASVNEFSSVMATASEAISRLEADSQNIGGVLDVIRGIAEQTNLLALNAAIEAARAGEQGRGFAVVADEVRTLASRTQESTEEINKMIQQLQAGAQHAVSTMQTGSQSIDDSIEKANDTNQMIEQISGAVSEIQVKNSDLAQAARTQADVTREINENVDNIRNVSSKTSESADKLLQLSQDINSAVNKINKQLSRFIHE